MNTDDFEQQLSRQPLRAAPPQWREDILAAAARHLPARVVTPADTSGGRWREWLQRFPLAWGAVAAVWIGILGINSLLFSPTSPSTSEPAAFAAQDPMSVWRWQRAQVAFLANGQLEFPETAPVPRRPEPASLPRSERRTQEGFGDIPREGSCSWMV
jgi:hypothetical protein